MILNSLATVSPAALLAPKLKTCPAGGKRLQEVNTVIFSSIPIKQWYLDFYIYYPWGTSCKESSLQVLAWEYAFEVWISLVKT